MTALTVVRRARLTRRKVLSATALLTAAAVSFAVSAQLGAFATTSTTSTSTAASTLFQTNQLVGDQAGFDYSAGGWMNLSSTATRLTGAAKPSQAGAGALSVTNSTPPPINPLAQSTANLTVGSGNGASQLVAATPGTRWLGRVSALAGKTGRAISVTVAFFNASRQRIDQATNQATVDSTKSWQRVPTVGIAPPNTAYVELIVNLYGVAAGETHYLDNAFLASAPGGSASVVGPLHTAGNQVIDGNGNPLILRGFNREGMEGDTGGDAPTADDMAHAKAWGANFIRLPLGEQYWLPTTCYYDPAYTAKVDAAVNLITGMGMVVLLDLHYTSMGPCGKVGGGPPMPEAVNALTFWQQVASRYKGNPLVAFDMYNEPHDVSDDVWRYGGSVTWKDTTFQAAGMQQMLDTIRGTGATNLVFASGSNWGNWFPKTAPLAGSNIVYAVHAYTCPQSAPPNCNNPAPYDPSSILKMWVTPGTTYPVVATEFGMPNPDDGTYIRNVIWYCEQHGWGWSVFTWTDATWSQFDLLASAGPGKSYEPRAAGMGALGAFPGAG